MYYGLSLLAFTQTISKGATFQDVVFKFESPSSVDGATRPKTTEAEDAPLLAHGNVLSYYSPVFAKILTENGDNRDDHHRIPIAVHGEDRRSYEAFIHGIYWRFTDAGSRNNASKEVFHLARKFQLPGDLMENLFSALNIWSCLEFAIEQPNAESFLLQKCEKMLRVNCACYTNAAGIQSVKGTTIAYALAMPTLPLKKCQLKDFLRLWKESLKDSRADFLDESELVTEAVMDLIMKEDPWRLPIIHIASTEVPSFSVEYNSSNTLQAMLVDVQFVSQVPKELICLKREKTGQVLDVSSEASLKELGIHEDDDLILRIRKVIRLLFSGAEHHIDIKDIDMVEELRQIAKNTLATKSKNVCNYQVVLLKDGVPLEDGSSLLQCGVKANSKISVTLTYKKDHHLDLPKISTTESEPNSSLKSTEIMTKIVSVKALGCSRVNLAADPDTVLTATSSYDDGRNPYHALPEAVDDNCWCANSFTPVWWCAEFSEPKILRRVQWTMYPVKACDGDNPKAFRIEGGNAKTEADFQATLYDEEDIRWTTLVRKDHEMTRFGRDCFYDIEDANAYKYCRIVIEKTRNVGNYALLHKIIINEAIF